MGAAGGCMPICTWHHAQVDDVAGADSRLRGSRDSAPYALAFHKWWLSLVPGTGCPGHCSAASRSLCRLSGGSTSLPLRRNPRAAAGRVWAASRPAPLLGRAGTAGSSAHRCCRPAQRCSLHVEMGRRHMGNARKATMAAGHR